VSDALLVAREGAVATLTMNRPATRNALDLELVRALASAFAAVSADADVRAVVLAGTGGSFCAGADLEQGMSGGLGTDLAGYLEQLHGLVRAIVGSPKPFVAAVDGAAVGFGCDLALACDLRVLAERGYLQEKFVQIGLMPDGGGTFWLPRLVGIGRAMELLMLGEKIDAARALELGLANRVFASEALASGAAELAARLAAGPPLALAAIKRCIRDPSAVDAALAREKREQVALMRSQDVMIGVAAWMSRTPPKFTGR
jgi:enoyl-CoA hydratase/carnithine racemase